MHYRNFTTYADAAFERGDKRLAKRIKIEGRIFAALVKAILDKGAAVSLNDEENGNGEWTVKRSTDFAEIMKAAFTSDGDLIVARDAEGNKLGWWSLIYGNDGYDVISDYSVTSFCEVIDRELQPVIDRAEYDMA